MSQLALAHREACPVGIGETISALQTLHAGDVTLQLPLLGRQRQTAGMTQAVLAWFELMVEGDTLIKHKALPFPAALLFGHLLQIVEDAALKMMNLGESTLLQEAAGLLTTNSTGSEHGDASR